ncbi:MAG: hypothetical protein ACQPRI_04385 [Solitalea-like symbiont of Tyrophagus putrescentiae]
MNTLLPDMLRAKCKDMGLSEKAIADLAGINADNLQEDASQQELEQHIERLLPYAKIIQTESTRRAQAAKKNLKQEDKPETAEAKPWQADIDALRQTYESRLMELKQENEQFKTLHDQKARKEAIKQLQQQHGISDEDMKFVAIPDDTAPEEFFKQYKQHLINKGLMTESAASMQIAKEQASAQLAKTLLSDIEVKS